MASLETTILGGFPVLVEFDYRPADADSGEGYGNVVDDYTLSNPKTGKEYGKWLYNRLAGDQRSVDRLDEQLYEAANE